MLALQSMLTYDEICVIIYPTPDALRKSYVPTRQVTFAAIAVMALFGCSACLYQNCYRACADANDNDSSRKGKHWALKPNQIHPGSRMNARSRFTPAPADPFRQTEADGSYKRIKTENNPARFLEADEIRRLELIDRAEGEARAAAAPDVGADEDAGATKNSRGQTAPPTTKQRIRTEKNPVRIIDFELLQKLKSVEGTEQHRWRSSASAAASAEEAGRNHGVAGVSASAAEQVGFVLSAFMGDDGKQNTKTVVKAATAARRINFALEAFANSADTASTIATANNDKGSSSSSSSTRVTTDSIGVGGGTTSNGSGHDTYAKGDTRITSGPLAATAGADAAAGSAAAAAGSAALSLTAETAGPPTPVKNKWNLAALQDDNDAAVSSSLTPAPTPAPTACATDTDVNVVKSNSSGRFPMVPPPEGTQVPISPHHFSGSRPNSATNADQNYNHLGYVRMMSYAD